MDFEGLLKVVHFEDCQAIAKEVFKRKHGDKLINLFPRDNSLEGNYPNQSRAHTYEQSVTALQYFGESISKLKVCFEHLKENEAKIIHVLINDYCSESLTKIIFDRSPYGLMYIQEPFHKVEQVELTRFTFTNKYGFGLDILFPNLRRLFMEEIVDNNVDVSFELPKLEYFSYFGSKMMNATLSNALEKITKRNPQIKRLVIGNVQRSELNVVQQNLPNLEVLQTERLYGYVNGNVHFDTVEKYVGRDFSNLTFSQLEVLEIRNGMAFEDSMFERIAARLSLRKLTIRGGPVKDENLLLLSKKLWILNEANFPINKKILVRTVTNFVKRLDYLKKVTLFTNLPDKESIIGILKPELAKTWQYSHDTQGVHLSRY